MREKFFLTSYYSPLGSYTLVGSQHGIVYISTKIELEAFILKWERQHILIGHDNKYNDIAAAELDAYFAGSLQRFTVALDLRGTAFQCNIWRELYNIPYGETRSYQQLAQAIGHPKAARPAGQAIGHNPISIIIPCHRVIGSDGSLTGYGGGLEKKIALLKLEGIRLSENSIPRRVKVIPLP